MLKFRQYLNYNHSIYFVLREYTNNYWDFYNIGRRVISYVGFICMVVKKYMLKISGRPITTSICFTLTEEIQCPVGQVVQVRSARYGRMELGTCITFDMGMGCFKDILQTADKWCSGKQSCVVENDRATMDKQLGLPCPAELTSYIEISHDCIGGKGRLAILFSPSHVVL